MVVPERVTLEVTSTQPATVQANFRAEIQAKVAGYLDELRVDIGDSVEADQVLGVIAVPEMDRDLERQEAVIDRLEAEERRVAAEVRLARAEVTSAEAALDRARAEIRTSTARLEAARSELERVRGLVSDRTVTTRLLDETQSRFEAADAVKFAADAALISAEADVEVAEARLVAASSRQETAEAETSVARRKLEELQVLVDYATLKAPFDGVVVQRHVDPGDLVQDTQVASGSDRPPLFVIDKLDRVRVHVPLPERDAASVDLGDPAEITLRAIPGRTFPGTITRSSRRLDPSTQTMPVEIALPNPEGILLPGMYGEATVLLERREALVLPAGTVRYDAEGASFVYLIDEDDRIQLATVQTGYDDGVRIEIRSGLEGGERVVGPTIDRLDQGQRVRVPSQSP